MASIKIVLRKNMIRKDGSIPLALRISENYKTNYKWLGQYVFEKDWDKVIGKVKSSHPNHHKLNNFLRKKLTEANDVYFDSKDESITPKQVKLKLKGPDGSKSFFALAAERAMSKYDRGIFSVAKSELSILYNIEEFLKLKSSSPKNEVIEAIKKRRRDRVGRAKKAQFTFLDGINHFKKSNTLKFRDIDQTFIERYKTFCSTYLNQKSRTITNQLIFIRTLFNIAIKDGVVDIKYYPFAGDKEKIRIGSGNKIGLNSKEIERIEKMDLPPGTTIWHAHNAWLISFYFAGMRISDVVQLKWSDFKDGRLFYVMNKNKKPLSLKIPDKAYKILNNYKKDSANCNGYVFPFLQEVDSQNKEEVFVKTRNASKLFNIYLKRIAKQCDINKNLSNHIARHSFGNIAGDRIHPLMLQKLYRHSDLKTTLNYQANFIHRDADEALDNVVNF